MTDLAVERDRAILDVVQAEDATLGRVDDRRRQQRAVDAAVADGEGAAGQLLEGELVVARRWPRSAMVLLDLGEAQPLGAANDRHHEALAAADRDADVVVVLVDDVVAADLALTAGNCLSASTAALTKNDMKPSLTPCFRL
jgi:hypothetical protein